MDEACERRMLEELGVRAKLTFLYKFEYRADFGDLGAEHELCWVYIGRCDEEPSINVNEASDWRYVDAKTLEAELENESENFTPWFKLEWDEICTHHRESLDAILKDNTGAKD
jgi:isopentenyl-diphosphate delta-isomerase